MKSGGSEKKKRVFETARCRHCIMATCALFITLPTALYAHHGTVTTRAMSEAAPATFSQPLGETESAPLTFGLSYAQSEWSPLSDSSQGLGSVSAQLFTLSSAAYFSPAWRLQGQLPLGWVQQLDDDAAAMDARTFSLGDSRFQLSRRGEVSALGLSLNASLTLLAPTGDYAIAQRLSTTEIRVTQGGNFERRSYYAQTSLGADRWGVGGALEGRWAASASLAVTGQLGVEQPVSETRDRILWGRDSSARAGLNWRLSELGADLSFAGSYLHHGEDLVPGVLATEDRSLVGGWSQLAAELGLGFSPAASWRCSLAGRLPLWQRAEPFQLVERFGFSMGCEYSLRGQREG